MSKVICEEMNPDLMYCLFQLITNTIKSYGEQSICLLAIEVVIFIARQSSSLEKIWRPQQLEIIFNVMVYYSDKDCLNFPRMCTIIWLLAHVEEYKNYITGNKTLTKQLEKMHARCLRKKKMITNMKQTFNCHTVFDDYSNLPMPTRTSKWPYESQQNEMFDNSVHAMTALLNILSFK